MSIELDQQNSLRRHLEARAAAGIGDALRHEEHALAEAVDPKQTPNARSLRRRAAFHPPRAGAPWEP